MFFSLGSGVFLWISKKQESILQSIAKTKYISIMGATNQAISLCKLLEDLRFKLDSPIKIFCDNKSTIIININPVQHG